MTGVQTCALPIYIVIIIKKKLTDAAVPPFKARRACTRIVVHAIYACSIVYTRVRITVICVWKKGENNFNWSSGRYCAPQHLENITDDWWIQRLFERLVLELTDGAVLSFKSRHASASVLVHSVNTCSIVFTRVGITVINIWWNTRCTQITRFHPISNVNT